MQFCFRINTGFSLDVSLLSAGEGWDVFEEGVFEARFMYYCILASLASTLFLL